MKDGVDVSLIQIQQEIKNLQLENQDLVARELVKTQRLKEIKTEANQNKIDGFERESELKYEIDEKDQEIERIRHRLLEAESVIDVKDEQVQSLEQSLHKLADKEKETNYFAELIE